MKIFPGTAVFVLFIFSGLAFAEVKDSGAGGFTTVNEVTIEASGEVVWRTAIEDVGLWWSSDHTVSGDASRLSITAVPQGCFCESFGKGTGVVHLSVTMVNPGVIIRLTGGLGPLGLMGQWQYDLGVRGCGGGHPGEIYVRRWWVSSGRSGYDCGARRLCNR